MYSVATMSPAALADRLRVEVRATNSDTAARFGGAGGTWRMPSVPWPVRDPSLLQDCADSRISWLVTPSRSLLPLLDYSGIGAVASPSRCRGALQAVG